MKQAFFIVIIALLIYSCSPGKETVRTSAALAPVSADSTEYELIVDDIRFEQWYMLNYSEAKDHSNDYYHSKNLLAVSNWNEYYRKGTAMGVIDSYINYQPQIDYGLELNRKLFWYFKFVRDNYNIKLF